MCVDRTETKIAKKDIHVYKVFAYRNRKFKSLFYLPSGDEQQLWENIDHKSDSLKEILTKKATFYGYHVFLNINCARKYITEIKSSYRDYIRTDHNLVIVSMIIPKGTKYNIGRIASHCIGSDIPAATTPVLKLER